jgi:hypothetical protein
MSTSGLPLSNDFSNKEPPWDPYTWATTTCCFAAAWTVRLVIRTPLQGSGQKENDGRIVPSSLFER